MAYLIELPLINEHLPVIDISPQQGKKIKRTIFVSGNRGQLYLI